MIAGIDFDNTIVSYDELFHKVAMERGLVGGDTPCLKRAVRDCLRAAGKEDIWTEMQGYVYGARMSEALPFSGVKEVLAALKARRIPAFIISHKTKTPYMGPAYDLHGAARNWLEENAFIDPEGDGLDKSQVFFELTKKEKIDRIARQGCTHFVDDLPEFLAEVESVDQSRRILFDPLNAHPEETTFQRAASWAEVARLLGL